MCLSPVIESIPDLSFTPERDPLKTLCSMLTTPTPSGIILFTTHLNYATIYINLDCFHVRYSKFDPTRPTQFLVHGFIDDGTVKWMKRLTANLLDFGDYNVIIVNWGGGSMPMYSQATANTRVVGLEIGHMVNTMIVSKDI